MPVFSLSSLTSCQLLNASKKLMYPGLPFKTSTGRLLPSAIKILAGFWLGLQPYFSCISFIDYPSTVLYLLMMTSLQD